MNQTKNLLRHDIKDIRKHLNIPFYSQKICENISSWEIYNNAQNVMIYSPFGSEFSLLSLLSNTNNKTKLFFFPSVCGDEIHPVFYDKSKGFKNGDFNIKEPIGEKLTDYSSIDLVFVPALAVDINGFRLGYGKGFYDRFLPHLSDRCINVVPISSKLVLDSIPVESHDKSVDYIVTENEIIPVSKTINSSISNC